MTSADQTLQQLIALEPIKTWSVIVTLLGDMEHPQLSGKSIGHLLGHLGLKPEATRVALHRLKNDGWITTSKRGREVIYQLSDYGVAETSAVYNDVYRTTPKHGSGWMLIIVERDDQMEEAGDVAIRIARRVYLLPHDAGVNVDSAMQFDVTSKTIPHWVEQRILDSAIVRLSERLTELATTHHTDADAQMQDQAIRLMFLHRWRKMALRANTWAHIGLFPTGPVASCHQQVTQWLAMRSRLTA